MKKTLTANIGGTVFHIEEDAYDRLQRYLSSIRSQFAGSESAGEIMADIEARIAELFTARIEDRQVVNLADVEHVIGVMGQPEDYLGDEETGGTGSASSAGAARRRYRRLYRDPEDRWVGGVLGGVAHYFGIDPLVMRLVYIVLLLLGVGWLIYIILWIVVPPADTAAEKLEMRGEPVNVDNIKRMFEEGAEHVKKGAERVAGEAKDIGQRFDGTSAQRGVHGFFGFLGEMLRLFFRFIGKFLGAIFLCMGAVAAVLLTILLFSRRDLFAFGSNADGQSLGDISGLLFLTPAQDGWAWIATTVFVLVPVIGLLYGGISLLFNVKGPRWMGWALAPLWIAAIIVMSVIGVRLANDFRVQAESAADHTLAAPSSGVLQLEAMSGRAGEHSWSTRYKHGRVSVDGDFFDAGGDSIRWADASVDIRRSPDSLYHLVMVRNARGASHEAAQERASGVSGSWVQSDSVLRLGFVVRFPKRDRIRAQDIDFIVLVPVGGAVFIDHSVEHMLDDVKNVTDTWDWEMGGRTWTMTSKGLEDLSAPLEEKKETEEWEHEPKAPDAPGTGTSALPVKPSLVLFAAEPFRGLPLRADVTDEGTGDNATAATPFRGLPRKTEAPDPSHAAFGLIHLLSRVAMR